MAFTEANRAAYRKYMGFTSLYLRAYPRYEVAIDLLQSTADGGGMVDNSTELLIKSALTELEDLEAKLKDLRIQAHVTKAGSDDIEINPAKGVFLLRSEARRQVRYLANAIGFDLEESDSLVF